VHLSHLKIIPGGEKYFILKAQHSVLSPLLILKNWMIEPAIKELI
jgi:hypothetical protein